MEVGHQYGENENYFVMLHYEKLELTHGVAMSHLRNQRETRKMQVTKKHLTHQTIGVVTLLTGKFGAP